MAFNEILKGFKPSLVEVSEKGKNRKDNKYKSGYSAEVIEQSRQAAREMAESGENMRSIPIGWESGHLYLSSDKNMVIGTETITVDGKIYYIGLAKNE
jgi:hypothetical protein